MRLRISFGWVRRIGGLCWTVAKDKFHLLRNRISPYYSTVTAKLNELRKKERSYWLKLLRHWGEIAFLIWLGVYLGKQMEGHHIGLNLRYKISQRMQEAAQWVSGKYPYDKNTVVVLIGDKEFWGTELARRSPLNREYLARLVVALDEFNPKVIALDTIFSSPMPDGSVIEHKVYEGETKYLLDTIRKVALHRTIILPRSIGFDRGYYVYESDIYNESSFPGTRVGMGHVSFAHDYRMIPLSVTFADGTFVDSFPEAIVRAYDTSGKALEFDQGDDASMTYAGYLYPEQFAKRSADEILYTAPDSEEYAKIARELDGKIVIVGGGWHKLALGRGAVADARDTPVGEIPGVFMHANYVEALLDSRTTRPWSERTLLILEILPGLATAIFFARKFWWVWNLLFIFGLTLALLIFAYLSWQNFGLFFDFFIPSVLVVGHAGYEQVNAWRKAANKYARDHQSAQEVKR